MSAHAQTQAHDQPHHPESHYVKIWGILVLLLVVSVLGPMIGNRWITLITAFGIALVKAFMVAKNFMHLDIQKPIVHFILGVALALMVLLYGALAPDIQKAEGQNWKKDAGFHHSFTTSEPHHAGGENSAPAHGAAAKPAPEHGKP